MGEGDWFITDSCWLGCGHYLGGLLLGSGWVDGEGAQLQSAAVRIRLKHCLYLVTFAWPTKAIFHKVGSIFAQTVSGNTAAFFFLKV